MGLTLHQKAKRWTVTLALAACVVLAGCSAIIRNHGYIPNQEDLDQIVVGVDSQGSVESLVGQPTTSGVLRDTGWYYIGSKVRHFGARRPKEIERQVVAISFAPDGTVTNIERFGLERGQVVTLSRRVTETSVRDVTFIRQIIRNFGQIDFGEALGG